MKPDLQHILQNDTIILYPLKDSDFEDVYAVASDPAVWVQHPNKDRWKREQFANFFKGAMEMEGAYKIVDKATGNVLGSTRFYGYNESDSSIYIGYTFYGTDSWGRGINRQVKHLMLNYIFKYVNKVYFQIGAVNLRSQIAIGRLGAVKTGEEEVAYFGEAPKYNFIYTIEKEVYDRLSEIKITPATVSDVETIQKIGRETFYETFAERNSDENMQGYLEKSFAYDKLAAEVSNPDSFFYIAWDDNGAVGYLKLNTGSAQTEPLGESFIEIERIYVKQQYHGKKVGQLLYSKAIETARSLNKTFAWLGVWEENIRAIRFYEKNGFKAFDTHIFMVGDDKQTDLLMRKEL